MIPDNITRQQHRPGGTVPGVWPNVLSKHPVRLVVMLLLASVMSACCSPETQGSADHPADNGSTVREHQELEKSMHDILSGDPVSNAEQALKAGDKRLWAYQRGRAGRTVPGIDEANVAQDIPVRIAPGMGDVVYGKTHQELRKQLLDYMQQYNRRILQAD